MLRQSYCSGVRIVNGLVSLAARPTPRRSSDPSGAWLYFGLLLVSVNERDFCLTGLSCDCRVALSLDLSVDAVQCSAMRCDAVWRGVSRHAHWKRVAGAKSHFDRSS